MENKTGNVYEFLDELDPELMSELSDKTFGRWVSIFREFMESDKKNCLISFKNPAERRSCLNSLNKWKSKYKLNIIVGNYKPGIRIYIVKC